MVIVLGVVLGLSSLFLVHIAIGITILAILGISLVFSVHERILAGRAIAGSYASRMPWWVRAYMGVIEAEDYSDRMLRKLLPEGRLARYYTAPAELGS